MVSFTSDFSGQHVLNKHIDTKQDQDHSVEGRELGDTFSPESCSESKVQEQLLQAMMLQNNVSSKSIFPDYCMEALTEAANGEKDKAEKLIREKKCSDTYIRRRKELESVDTLFEIIALEYLKSNPQKINQTGLLESVGYRQMNNYLDDYSKEAIERSVEAAETFLKHCERFDFAGLTPQQKVSYQIFSWWAENTKKGTDFLFHEYFVNQMFGPLSSLSETLTQFHKIETFQDLQTFLNRLESISGQFCQLMILLRLQKERGIVPPKFALERVLNSINQFIAMPISENPFYNYFKEGVEKLEELDHEKELLHVKDIMENSVIPSYKLLERFIRGLLSEIKSDNGVSELPNGNKYYAYCLERETTTEMTPDEVYELGLKEVETISKQMRELLASVGIEDANKSVGELMSILQKDAKHYYPNTEEGKEACIQGFYDILERSRKELSQYFDLKPDAPVKILRTPKHEEESMPGGYYYEPSIDGSRPGAFYANLRDTKELPKYGMETLLVHESEPGHHFQLTIQSQAKIPLLRKVLYFNAYIEGWALYVEKLAYEQGFYSTAYDKLGHLQDELLRAVRLVVDPAIHVKGWRKEKAVDYMIKELGYERDTVVTEVERYFVMPGQACSYKIGQLKILELRQKVMDKLGDDFDIRQFHNVILEVGACPLDVLENVVKERFGLS